MTLRAVRSASLWALLALAATRVAYAQPLESALRVTVVDPSGAVIIGATVHIVGPDGAERLLPTGDRGQALFDMLAEGRYTIRAESPGFDPGELTDVRVRGRETRREIRLTIARIAEDLVVGRDPREARTDPKGDAFATVLTPEQIAALPDDPDELEEALNQLAGPGATMRVNGFRGGRLPPKSQIQSIRFRRNFYAADSHEPGFHAVDITTKPGSQRWQTSFDIAFRDESLNSRNAYAPEKGDESQQRGLISIEGPIWKNRTSLAITTDGLSSFDTKTINAALPDGNFSDIVERPTDRYNFGARVEHALSASHALRVEYQRGDTRQGNLGVGDYDLPERAYARQQESNVFRIADSGGFGKHLFNELRFQVGVRETANVPFLESTAVQVLNAFTTGGAEVRGGRRARAIELADNLDLKAGRHAIRAGFLLEAARYRSDENRNASGSYTFSSLDDFEASQPATYSRRVGDPLVEYSHYQFGWYFQDDIRARKDLTVSVGLRHEFQSHLDDRLNFAPRGGLLWSPFRDGKTTFRGGAGIFYDWLDATTYEQTLRVDGVRQQDVVITDPAYPNLVPGVGTPLPGGRIQLGRDLEMPPLLQTSAGIERRFGAGATLFVTYLRTRGWDSFRGRNLNAPGPNGVRPDPTLGNVTSIVSTAKRSEQLVSVNFNFSKPEPRIMLAANYTLGSFKNEADTPLSLPADNLAPGSDWGPSPSDVRHRLTGLVNVPIWRRLRLGAAFRASSAPPYNITTGFDDNGDTVFTDRPERVGRNSARATGQFDMSARLSWSFGIGQRAVDTAAGPRIQIVRVGPDDLPAGGPMMNDGAGGQRVRVELFASASNLLNTTNPINFSGVQTSPFFGEPTAALPARRVELGVRFAF
jgi:Carboxypeptidase regulatory-like domain